LRGGTQAVVGGAADPILRESTANDPMDFDTCLWDEIQDAPGEIFDVWEDDAELEAFSLECCFGPEE
jgi:hypothetical protein